MAPYTLCTVQPYFTVKDWEAARPIMEEFVKKVDGEANCIYYGWAKSGDQLFCTEAYTDGDAALKHLENIGECIGKILNGPAKLDRIEFHAPAAELEKVKEEMDKIGVIYFEIDSGFTNMKQEAGAEHKPLSLCTVRPYFTVKDWEAVRPLMEEFVTKTGEEKDCVYYGWTKKGDTLFCREGYVDGDAINAHLANVGSLLEKMLDGKASLDSLEIHGPASEIEKVKPGTEKLGTVYFEIDSGFQAYSL